MLCIQWHALKHMLYIEASFIIFVHVHGSSVSAIIQDSLSDDMHWNICYTLQHPASSLCTYMYYIDVWQVSTEIAMGWLRFAGFIKTTCLFCKRALQKRLYSAKETYNFKEHTHRSHPIPLWNPPNRGTRIPRYLVVQIQMERERRERK